MGIGMEGNGDGGGNEDEDGNRDVGGNGGGNVDGDGNGGGNMDGDGNGGGNGDGGGNGGGNGDGDGNGVRMGMEMGVRMGIGMGWKWMADDETVKTYIHTELIHLRSVMHVSYHSISMATHIICIQMSIQIHSQIPRGHEVHRKGKYGRLEHPTNDLTHADTFNQPSIL